MALFPLHFVPTDTKFDFLGKKWFAFILSATLIIATIVLLTVRGLNLGIDFTGGILIEAGFSKAPSLSDMRKQLAEEELGDVSLQQFGSDKVILIRVGQKTTRAADRIHAIDTIKKTLAIHYGHDIDYRKVDYVGPKVGAELIQSGALALLLSFVAMMLYIWFRFEWQFGLGGIIALLHDAILTLGFFSLTQLEFNLSSIAAILTIVGYSINDSVVVFDRIRENLRKFKTMPLEHLLNISVNNTLSRTILTAGTTALALLALVFLGGAIIQSFSLAALFGVIIGTYSSVYIAAPVLIFMGLRKDTQPHHA